jgi:hypothetical protein
MTDPINTGWWPTPPHPCIRCGKPTESALYLLCEACHSDDKAEEADREEEIHFARYGY